MMFLTFQTHLQTCQKKVNVVSRPRIPSQPGEPSQPSGEEQGPTTGLQSFMKSLMNIEINDMFSSLIEV